MLQQLPLKIAGLGRHAPGLPVTNHEIERIVGVKEGTIDRSAAGVKERYWAAPDVTNSQMGAAAAREAVSDAKMKLEDVDLILNASGTFEQAIPDGGVFLQRELGLSRQGIPCLTIHSTCMSFLNALQIAGAFLATGQYKRILIVSSEILTRSINPKNIETMSIFGDMAAAAVVVKPQPGEPSRLLKAQFATYSEGADLAHCRIGTKHVPGTENFCIEDIYFTMLGKKLFALTHHFSPAFLEKLRSGLSKGLGTVELIVPHQPSGMAIRSLSRFRWPAEKIIVTLDRFGNTSASSLPGALYEARASGRLERGMEILMVGTGAGLNLGAILLVY
jgi:3-oxoacyl-[acyl-carrier-protein] synthase-3